MHNLIVVPLLPHAASVVLRIEPGIDPKVLTVESQRKDVSLLLLLLAESLQLLLSLHACGDLSCTAMRVFAANPNASLFVNAPCCYHSLTIRADQLVRSKEGTLLKHLACRLQIKLAIR